MSESRRLPPWLLGLILAVVFAVAILAILAALGIGDDPVIGSTPALG